MQICVVIIGLNRIIVSNHNKIEVIKKNTSVSQIVTSCWLFHFSSWIAKLCQFPRSVLQWLNFIPENQLFACHYWPYARPGRAPAWQIICQIQKRSLMSAAPRRQIAGRWTIQAIKKNCFMLMACSYKITPECVRFSK